MAFSARAVMNNKALWKWKQMLTHDARGMNNSVHPVDVPAAKQYLYLTSETMIFIFFLNVFLQLQQSERIIRMRYVWQTGLYQAHDFNITEKDESLNLTAGSVNNMCLFLRIKSTPVIYRTINV